MLRAFFIRLSSSAWMRRFVSSSGLAWRVASRFIAGNSIADAIRTVKDLNDKGINATLDHLGESTTTRQEAFGATRQIVDLLDHIERGKIRANVSLKLTQIGMMIDQDLCISNLEKILVQAGRYDNFVRIDMEDSKCTESTIRIYREMKKRGFEKVGLALQAYLYRTEADIESLLKLGTRIRLVKGAYQESEDIAYPKKADVDVNFDRLVQKILQGSLEHGSAIISPDGRVPPLPALGTHDERRIRFAKSLAAKLGLPNRAIEFQMLYGIRRDLQEQCRAEGYPVRVYVPYGTHWYPYFMRRLAERPANLWFFVVNFFRK
jgi:proline dehydrogenase